MKCAGNETRILRHTENDERTGKMWGVYLAADSTAEHEFGIDKLLDRLGIDPKGRMLIGRSMQGKTGVDLPLAEWKGSNRYLIEEDGRTRRSTRRDHAMILSFRKEGSLIDHYVKRHNVNAEVTGAWDGNEFLIAGWTDAGREIVNDLQIAIKAGGASVWLGGVDNPFINPGLIIAITSRIPAKATQKINESDTDTIKLEEAVKQTGIRDRLLAAAFEGEPLEPRYGTTPWHALEPRWLPEHQRSKSAHPVQFYLNPHNQTRYNFGWFTVEELDQWIEGKGPIVKTGD